MTGIYKIESKVHSDRIYIGSAVNIQSKKRTHLHHLLHKNHHNPKLQAHYNKYGVDDLIFTKIIECDKESLIAFEQFYIDSLNPWFNVCPKAGSNLGIKRSKQACINIGKAKIGSIPWNKGLKTGINIPTSFKKGSIPWNKGLKGFSKGRKMTQEQNKKNSLSKMRDKNPMYGKVSSQKGKKLTPHSEETKQKMRISHLKRWEERKLKTA